MLFTKSKSALCLLVLFLTVFSLILSDEQEGVLQASDEYLNEHSSEIERLLKKKHLSFNKNSTQVSQVKPIIWGFQDRILVMLEVKHYAKNCSSSRNVVFLLDTGAPYTVISPTLKKLIYNDCNLLWIEEEQAKEDKKVNKIIININGRQTTCRYARDHYANTNVIGMDYMTANRIQFSMKIHPFDQEKSILNLKFDAEWNETDL